MKTLGLALCPIRVVGSAPSHRPSGDTAPHARSADEAIGPKTTKAHQKNTSPTCQGMCRKMSCPPLRVTNSGLVSVTYALPNRASDSTLCAGHLGLPEGSPCRAKLRPRPSPRRNTARSRRQTSTAATGANVGERARHFCSTGESPLAPSWSSRRVTMRP